MTNNKPGPPAQDRIALTFRMPTALYHQVRDQVRAGRSMNTVLIDLITAGLKATEKEQPQ